MSKEEFYQYIVKNIDENLNKSEGVCGKQTGLYKEGVGWILLCRHCPFADFKKDVSDGFNYCHSDIHMKFNKNTKKNRKEALKYIEEHLESEKKLNYLLNLK